MNLKINIQSIGQCKLSIQDLSTYLPESDKYSNRPSDPFKKSDVRSLVLVQLNSLKDDPVIKHASFDLTVPIEFDGHFTIHYIVLPTKKWIDDMIASNSIRLGVYQMVYYTDKNSIYLYNKDGQDTLVTDLSDLLDYPNITTTVSKTSVERVSICNLQKCYVNLCQQIFEDKAFVKCQPKSYNNDELVYRRDLVWMGINTIKYMTEQNQMIEAQRIIELLTGCNGVCGGKKTGGSNGCGCS